MTTPCGQPTTTTCPGTQTTLEHGHTHQLAPEEERHSKGSRTIRGAAQRRGFDQVDAQPSNWCPACQTTLMRCYRAGCGQAKTTAMSYAYLAAVYALNTTRGKYGRAWSSEENEWATHVAHRKAMSRVTGTAGNPDQWPSQPTSLVNYFAGYVQGDIKSELKRKFGLIDDDTNDAPIFPVTITRPGPDGTTTIDPNAPTTPPPLNPQDDDPDPLDYTDTSHDDTDNVHGSHPSPATPPTRRSQTPTHINTHPSGIDSLGHHTGRRGEPPALAPWTSPAFPNPETATVEKLFSELLMDELITLTDFLKDHLTGLDARGPHGQSPTPRELMLTYLANVMERCRDVDAAPWQSERDIVRDRFSVLHGWEPDDKGADKKTFNALQSNIRRTRTEVLAPACQGFIDDLDNDLTHRQRTALACLLDHIRGDRLTFDPPPTRRPRTSNPTEAGPK